MELKICENKECKNKFIPKAKRQIYCCSNCSHKVNYIKNKLSYKKYAKKYKEISYKKINISEAKSRTCLGPNCQGKKYFKSSSPYNRVCENCKKTFIFKAKVLI